MTMKKTKRILAIAMIVTLLAALIYMIFGIYSIQTAGVATSFPWTWACFMTGVYFGPILGFELIILTVLWLKEKRNSRD